MARLSGIRLIKNGRVKFFGKYYIPFDYHRRYKNELDGQKWFFISYLPSKDMLYLWGDEKSYNLSNKSQEAFEKDSETRRPNNMDKNGYVYWLTWIPEDSINME